MTIRNQLKTNIINILLILSTLLLVCGFSSNVVHAEIFKTNQPAKIAATEVRHPMDKVDFDLMYSINNQIPTNKTDGVVKEGDEVLIYVNVGWNIGSNVVKNVGIYGGIPSDKSGNKLEVIPGSVSNNGLKLNDSYYWKYSQITGLYYITFIYRVKIPSVDKDTNWTCPGTFEWTDDAGNKQTFHCDSLTFKQYHYDVSVEIEQKNNSRTSSDFTKDKLYVNTGETVNYQITVKNNSSAPITNVDVTNKVFSKLNPTGFKVDGGVFIPSENEDEDYISWTIAEILAGQSKVLTYTITIPDIPDHRSPEFANTVNIKYKELPGANITSNTVNIEQGVPDLKIDFTQKKSSDTNPNDSIEVATDEIIEYTIKVINLGTLPAENAYIFSQIPTGLKLDEVTTPNDYTIENHFIYWQIPKIEVNSTQEIKYKLKVQDVLPDTIAYIHAGIYNDLMTRPIESKTVQATMYPTGLGIALYQSVPNYSYTADEVTAENGQTIEYGLRITNHDPNNEYKNIKVTNTIPTGLDVNSVQVLGENGTIANNTITWNLGSLSPNQSKDIAFNATIKEVNGDKIENSANLNWDKSDSEGIGSISSNKVIANINPIPEENRIVTFKKSLKEASSNDFSDNQLELEASKRKVTYKLTVTNSTGSDLTNINVMDNLPVSSEHNCNITSDIENLTEGSVIEGNSIKWLISKLLDGETKEFIYTIEIPKTSTTETWISRGILSYYNTNISSGVQTLPSNEVTAIYNPGEINPETLELEFNKKQSIEEVPETDSTIEVKSKSTITYSITFENKSDVCLTNVRVSDLVPTSNKGTKLALIDDSISPGIYPLTNKNNLEWNLGNILAGSKAELTFQCSVPEVTENQSWKNKADLKFLVGSDEKTITSNEVTANFTKTESENPGESQPSNPPSTPSNPNQPGTPSVTRGVSVVKSQSLNNGSLTLQNLNVSTGDKLTYNIQVTNHGSLTENNLILTDQLPSGSTSLELDPTSVNQYGSVDKNTISWKINSLKLNESINLSFRTSVPAVTKDTTWNNTAILTGLSSSGIVKSNNVSATCTNQEKLALKMRHSLAGKSLQDSKLSVKPGDIVQYHIEVTNPTKIDATNLTLTDSVPSDLEILSDSITSNGTLNNHKITWKISSLAAHRTQKLSFKIKIPENATTSTLSKAANHTWTNSAELMYDGFNGRIKSNEVVSELMQLSLVKTQSVNSGTSTTDPVAVRKGDNLTYSIEVTNLMSSALNNISITDTLPDGLTSKDNSSSQSGRSNSWNINSLEPGESTTVKIEAVVDTDNEGTIIENTAYASCSELDNNVESNTVAAEVTNKQNAVLLLKEQSSNGVNSTSNPINLSAPEPISYHLTVINGTAEPVYDVNVFDTAPEGTEIIESSITDYGTLTDNRITWNIDRVDPGESKTFDFTCQVLETTNSGFINTASLDYQNNDNAVIYSNEVRATILGTLTVNKLQGTSQETLAPSDLTINDNSLIYYQLTVNNNTDNLLTRLTLTDPLAEGLTVNPSSISNGGTVTNNIITWNIPSMEPGATVTVSFTANANFIGLKNELINTAMLSIGSLDEIITSNSVTLTKAEGISSSPNLNNSTGTPSQNSNSNIVNRSTTTTSYPSVSGSNQRRFQPTSVRANNTRNNSQSSVTPTKITSNNPKTGLSEGRSVLTLIVTLALMFLFSVLQREKKHR